MSRLIETNDCPMKTTPVTGISSADCVAMDSALSVGRSRIEGNGSDMREGVCAKQYTEVIAGGGVRENVDVTVRKTKMAPIIRRVISAPPLSRIRYLQMRILPMLRTVLS